MQIIDTHIHFWDLANNINTWVSRVNEPSLVKNYLPNQILNQSKEQLNGVIHVEAHDSAVPTITEINWLGKVMTDTPNLKYKHIAFVDITLPSNEFAKTIESIRVSKNVIGIRHILSCKPGFDYSPCEEDMSKNPNIPHNLSYLANLGLIFDCQMYPYQIDNIIAAIKTSGVTCVVDHLVLPAWKNENDEDHKIWQNTITELAKLDNVYIKVSGIDMFRKEPEFKKVLDFCFNTIPSSHLIYGSNYPVSFNHDYNYWYDYLNKYELSDATKEQLFFKTANNIFFKK